MTNLFENEEIPVAPEVSDTLQEEKPDYIHLSDVFKYISHYRRGGHQIGRKVGDMLEVLTLAAISLNENAKARMVLEPKLIGFSGAGHKVEFGFFHLDEKNEPNADMAQLAAFIECKKVGVEQTIDSSFKRNFGANAQIPYDQEINIRFAPKWAKAVTFSITFQRVGSQTKVKVTTEGEECHEAIVGDGERIIFGITTAGESFLLGNEESLRNIEHSIRACRILEIRNHTDKGVQALLNTCLAGPQTPEKAKQASFVALDVRKGLFGQFDKRPDETECVSVLVMTEFSHWEPKSVNMIKASIDYNLVIDDSLIIEAMRAFEKVLGDDFLDSISKETFLKNTDVQKIATGLVGNGRIFRDIQDDSYKRITMTDKGRMIIE